MKSRRKNNDGILSSNQQPQNLFLLMYWNVSLPREYKPLPTTTGGNGNLSFCSLNSFASVWCCIENIFLAGVAEGLACPMRIPVGNEGLQVAESVYAPKGDMLSCYIGLGYPAKNAIILEQMAHPVKNTLHFGTWENGGKNDYQHRRANRYRPILYRVAVEPLFRGLRTFTQPIISEQSNML